LLHDQVGVVDFAVYKRIFMQSMQAARTCYLTLPSLPPLNGYPLRNWWDICTYCKYGLL